MCFWYAINKGNTSSLVKNKVITEKQSSIFQEKLFVNGFEHPVMPIKTNSLPGEIQNFSWGYIPENIQGKEQADNFLKSYNTLNARSETIFNGKLFGKAIQSRRCLVFCSGFFEWQQNMIPGKPKPEKHKYYITLNDDEMFVFGGIWNSFADNISGELISTYSIITTDANEMMAVIHNTKKRMPLIFDAEIANEWLRINIKNEEILKLMKPFDQDKMKAVRVE